MQPLIRSRLPEGSSNQISWNNCPRGSAVWWRRHTGRNRSGVPLTTWKRWVRLARFRQPLHPAALPLGPLRFSFQLLGLAGVRRARVDGKAAKAATLAILPVTLVDHQAKFR